MRNLATMRKKQEKTSIIETKPHTSHGEFSDTDNIRAMASTKM